MSNSGSRLAIIGPIIGFILVYFIVGAAMDQVQADQETLKEFGVATVQDLQKLGPERIEAIEEVQVEEVIAEDEAVDEAVVGAEEEEAQTEAAEDDAAVVEEEASGGAVEADTAEAAEDTAAAAVDEAPAEAEVAVEDEVAAKDEAVTEAEETATIGGQGRQGQGVQGQGGGGSEMQARHMAPIPDEYAGLTVPIAADAESLARGAEHFEMFCATCHGSEGLGDGPASVGLDPTPPMIAQTSLMTGDDYLFWRISEGGAYEPFSSAMPAWKTILDEQARWDTINYVRSLGGMNGAAGSMREEMQATMQAEMLASAIEQDVIDSGEAELFADVHGQLDDYRLSLGNATTGNMDEMQAELLAGMVEAGNVSQADADAFSDIHARLDAADLMQ